MSKNNTRRRKNKKDMATLYKSVQLLITTGQPKYAQRFVQEYTSGYVPLSEKTPFASKTLRLFDSSTIKLRNSRTWRSTQTVLQ
jgi:hypothetical protein